MRACRRPWGFTLFELMVVVCLVSLLAGFAFERLLAYQEAAEAAAAESNLAILKSTLHIRSAELISANRWEELQRLPQQNPFDLLEERPANYGGAFAESAAPGKWYFDSAAAAVVYRVARTDGFSAEGGGHDMRFAVVGRDVSGKAVSGSGVAYVSLRALGSYRWFDRQIR